MDSLEPCGLSRAAGVDVGHFGSLRFCGRGNIVVHGKFSDVPRSTQSKRYVAVSKYVINNKEMIKT